jgi:hypothetical protein
VPSRSWKRIHRGAPLKSEYRKLPSNAQCDDCPWSEALGEVSIREFAAFRERAADHAAVKHHRVHVWLHQEVILEPKHAGTREAALADAEEPS